jgi:hypothetical protein
VAVAVHPDALILSKGRWTPWSIRLAEFSDAGVDLTRIDTMYLGAGDRGNPVPGGAGRFFVDDFYLAK